MVEIKASPTAPLASGTAITRHRRKEARPSELIAAALELFVEKGFVATRLDDVARQAGVSKGTLYLYFDSKEALFKAAIQEGLTSVLDQIDFAPDAFSGTTIERMEAMLIFWCRMASATPLGGMIRLLISESRNFPKEIGCCQKRVNERMQQVICRSLEKGMANREFRTIDVGMVTELILAPLTIMIVFHESFDRGGIVGHFSASDSEEYLRIHLGLVMHGLLRKL